MEYPRQYHDIVEVHEYRVHDYMGVNSVYPTLKEARLVYKRLVEEEGRSFITRKTVRVVTLESYEHIQGRG